MNNQSEDKSCSAKCGDFSWWAILVVAVLAVPALGILIALVTGARGFFGVAVIMVTCWISTYLGMRLMKIYDMKKK